MKEIVKKQYKDILLVLGYIIIAVAVYATLSQNLWDKWYISLLVGFGVAIIGAIIGVIYIKSIIDSKKE